MKPKVILVVISALVSIGVLIWPSAAIPLTLLRITSSLVSEQFVADPLKDPVDNSCSCLVLLEPSKEDVGSLVRDAGKTGKVQQYYVLRTCPCSLTSRGGGS